MLSGFTLLIVSMLFSVAGLSLFAETQRSLRRRSQRGELSSGKHKSLRVAAWLLLAIAWYCAAQRLGAQLGSLFWLAELGVLGLLLTVLLALRHSANTPMPAPRARKLSRRQQT